MDFTESNYLYIIGAFIAFFVMAQSVYFLVRAVRRGKQLGIATKVMKDAAISSAAFSIVPSVPIVIAMITLAATIGAPFSWIRLSVIGSMSYETMAAGAVAKAADTGITISVYAAIMWVMTMGIISGPLFNLIGFKKYQTKIAQIGERNPKWSKILIDALFMGIIAVMGGQFVAKGIAAFSGFHAGGIINGETQFLTLVSGAVLMLIFGLLIKLLKAKWLENFALPVSMIGAVALSVVFHGLF